MKKAYTLAILILTFLLLVPCPSTAAKKGIDRDRVKDQAQVYPVTLTIGGMSFRGTLSRMDKATDEEVEKAIKDALKEMGLTELEIAELQETVERVAQEEELTQEDIDRVLGNLMKLAGVDSVVDLIKSIGSANADAFADALEGYATDEAKGKALEWILEQAVEGAGDAAGVVTKLLDAAVISADQYDRDQQKWKDRVDAANAERKLNEFYFKVKDRLDGLRGMRSHGWALKIEDSASKNFTFFTTEGNLQIWTVNLLLKKFDTKQNPGPNGKYSGVVIFTVEYEMSPFDQGFEDWAINKSGMLDAQKAYFDKMKKVGISGYDVTYTPDDYDPTFIRRTLDGGDYSTSLSAPLSKGQSVRTRMDFTKFSDTKETTIRHSINVSFKTSGKVKYDISGTFDYISQNEDCLKKNYKNSGTMTAQGKTLSGSVNNVSSNIDFDSSLWEMWEKEKWLEITYP